MLQEEPFIYRGGGYLYGSSRRKWSGEGDEPPRDITRIIVHPSVTCIGDWAFSWCTSLSSIEMSPGITSIGHEAFQSCMSLKEVELPPSITSIGYTAFLNCKSLKSLVNNKNIDNIDNNIDNGWRILHAALSDINCTSEFIDLVLELHPEEIERVDQNGNLPLHVAAGMPPSYQKGNYIKTLFDMYPQAASRRNNDGKLPLMFAIESGKSWSDGVEVILKAFPAASIERDKRTNLFPFMVAAQKSCLDSVYNLLRIRPEMGKFDHSIEHFEMHATSMSC